MISSQEIFNKTNVENSKVNFTDVGNYQKGFGEDRKCRNASFGNSLHKSNEGDVPSCSSEEAGTILQEDFPNMQKWQSLGKVFRRQCVVNEKVQTLGRDIRKEAESLKSKGASVKNFITSYYQKAVNTITSRESSASSSQRKHRERHPSEKLRERRESEVVLNGNGEMCFYKN